MKFVLLVEGDTEKLAAGDFLSRWLNPQLERNVGIQVVRFSGYSELLRKVATKAQMHLDGPRQSQVIAVIGLIDLYGPHEFYPSHAKTADERYEWGTRHIEKEVGRDRFRMFFAVHDFEAWLLSQPTIFPSDIKSALPGKIAQLEAVNFDEPPAKLLDKVYKARTRRNYKKTTYGRELFGKLDPVVAAQKCPRLSQMLNEMLRLAKSAGN
ncbi:MAG: DUF4276 family protein [Planctomycetota bacterium]|nr:MAG: DUF4276 family protein [Planctomycetota bacterium]REK31063.1 MAG: DUF4276 family protein [Planctomycetota bacterium]REK36824.1 MAG: DUF4276 family protein [Planctomycetota bacterium]